MPNKVIECPHCKGNTICRCGTCTNDRVTIPSQCRVCKGLAKIIILNDDTEDNKEDNRLEKRQLTAYSYKPFGKHETN